MYSMCLPSLALAPEARARPYACSLRLGGESIHSGGPPRVARTPLVETTLLEVAMGRKRAIIGT